MQVFSYLAVYFIVWWLTLFAVLPFGMRTQAEADEVVLGTVASAPARFRGLRVMLITTCISAVIYAAYIAADHYGYSLDALPQFYPEFE